MERIPRAVHKIAAIAAMSENRVIGQDNKLPWTLPEDWANFHRVTKGKAFIMGRKSYESEDALISSYKNVILSRQKGLSLVEHCQLAESPAEALALLQDEEEVFILGGSSIFEQMMPSCNQLYLTIVHHTFVGDAYFPEVDWSQWKLTKSVYHPIDEQHAYAFSLNEYARLP